MKKINLILPIAFLFSFMVNATTIFAQERPVEVKQNELMGKAQTLPTGTRITESEINKRERNLKKAKAIAKINKANGRVKAANETFAKAQSKFKTMKASGQYTPEQIKQKQILLVRYQEYLLRLKGSIKSGNSQIN